MFSLVGLDTVVIDTGLQAAHEYVYQAQRCRGAIPEEESPAVQARTLDTTSHEFTWQMFTLGDGAGSTLYDIAILNDTLAYAVGEINTLDSTGQWRNPPFNLANWDGRSWSTATALYYEGGQSFYGAINALTAINADDIWFGIGNLIHWNGHEFQSMKFPPGVWGPYYVRKMWSSGKEIYVIGDGGSIASSLDGGMTWQKLSSGTTLDVRDIWGGRDPATGQEYALAVATRNLPMDRAVLSIQGTSVTALRADAIPYELFGVWFVPNRHYYVVGDGVYEKRELSEPEWKKRVPDITRYATTAIRGNALNDVFVVGAFGEVLHFNGVSWKSYIAVTGLANGSYTAVAVRGNLVIAVGGDAGGAGTLAVVLVGRR
jgi:hypothetical protein